MPLRLEIKKILSSRSDRVKCVDLHPIEPWVLSALYSGSVFLWDFDTSTMIKSWEVCDLPVRTAKFIMRKQWFICASDDMHLRVFNYNTMEKVRPLSGAAPTAALSSRVLRFTTCAHQHDTPPSCPLRSRCSRRTPTTSGASLCTARSRCCFPLRTT